MIYIILYFKMYMPLSAFNRPGNDETTHQVQWHSLFRFISIQRPLSIPHILRECANKSHQQNLTYLHYQTHKLEILVLSSVLICFSENKKTYELMIWWTYARFIMKSPFLGLWNQERLRSHSRFIPPGFPNCQLLFLSSITKDSIWQGFTKGHQTQ